VGAIYAPTDRYPVVEIQAEFLSPTPLILATPLPSSSLQMTSRNSSFRARSSGGLGRWGNWPCTLLSSQLRLTQIDLCQTQSALALASVK